MEYRNDMSNLQDLDQEKSSEVRNIVPKGRKMYQTAKHLKRWVRSDLEKAKGRIEVILQMDTKYNSNSIHWLDHRDGLSISVSSI